MVVSASLIKTNFVSPKQVERMQKTVPSWWPSRISPATRGLRETVLPRSGTKKDTIRRSEICGRSGWSYVYFLFCWLNSNYQHVRKEILTGEVHRRDDYEVIASILLRHLPEKPINMSDPMRNSGKHSSSAGSTPQRFVQQ